MSEKSKYPEIIYLHWAFWFQNDPNRGVSRADVSNYKTEGIEQVEYILKSKYDELLYRLGKVECYVIDLRREKDELSLENARLTADLAKVQAQLERVKFKPSNIVISTETTYTKQNNPTK